MPKPNYKVNRQWRIGVVTSRFNEDVTSKLHEGALRKLKELGFQEKQIHSLAVPGAFEIPLAAGWLLDAKCDGVIALGAVIRGETSHYDYVCSAVERGCTSLQLSARKPVVFGVLTTENEEQAFNRVGGLHGHKGEDAALTLVEMLNIYEFFKKQKNQTKEKTHGRR